jgi:hypothetical protein
MNRDPRTLLVLERAMLELDEFDEESADRLRDMMDPIWYRLSAQDRDYLNSRDMEPALYSAAVRVHATTIFTEEPPASGTSESSGRRTLSWDEIKC